MEAIERKKTSEAVFDIIRNHTLLKHIAKTHDPEDIVTSYMHEKLDKYKHDLSLKPYSKKRD